MNLGKTALLALAIPLAFATQAPAQSMAQGIMIAEQMAGTTVTVESVTLENDGFLVIHAMKDGKPVVPGSLGFVALKAGTHKDVKVELSEAIANGEAVLAMLHTDDGMMGEYKFPDGDAPVMMDGKPLVAKAMVN
jgi:hypothetical protein